MVQVNVDIAQELLPDRGKQGEAPKCDDVIVNNMTLASAHLMMVPYTVASFKAFYSTLSLGSTL